MFNTLSEVVFINLLCNMLHSVINTRMKKYIYFTSIFFVKLCVHDECIYNQELFEVGSSRPYLPGVDYCKLRKIQVALCFLSFSQLDTSLAKTDLIH